MELSTKVSAHKAFRIYLAKIRRVLQLMMNNLINEVRPHQLVSVINQADIHLRNADRFMTLFDKVESNQQDLGPVLDPLRDVLGKWHSCLVEKREALDRFSQFPNELDGQPQAILGELRVNLESIDETLVDLRGISKALEDPSTDQNGSGVQILPNA